MPQGFVNLRIVAPMLTKTKLEVMRASHFVASEFCNHRGEYVSTSRKLGLGREATHEDSVDS